MVVALLGLMGLQLLLLSVSLMSQVSLAPIAYLQVVPTIAQPSIAYVILWPVALIGISLLALRVPTIEA
ncbi:hypothetical protein FC12_GL001646 [Lacticaseibacillus paracasei subsp. tolerans DSM 20258]|nr:hypothetical protein FC12_GL001646 [Lacticaseibacillus paracasei subsp. tolerans DSM 20258]